MTGTIEKYLARYACPEIALAPELPGGYAAALVIPACDEGAELLDGVAAACRVAPAGRALCILVVNASRDHSDEARLRNRELVDALARAYPGHSLSDGSTLADPGGFHLLVIDRSSGDRALPAGEGVGLARRIGCDLALALHAAGKLASRWIHTTDADATLPADYFARTAAVHDPGVSAATYRFWHVGPGDREVSPALALYELSLRHYVVGMRNARPWLAFHTLGSALAITADAYAGVRGVPRRLAGEDFYLLDKAARFGQVQNFQGAPILIRERASSRVPFGTGPGTARIAAELAAGREPVFYDPRIFPLVHTLLENLTSLDEVIAAHPLLHEPVGRLRLRELVADMRTRTRTPYALNRRLQESIGGLRVLKLVHSLRERLPSIPWPEALHRIGLTASFTADPLTARPEAFHAESHFL